MKTLFDLEHQSCMLEGMIDGLGSLWGSEDKASKCAMIPMLNAAKQMAKELSEDLDCVNRSNLKLPNSLPETSNEDRPARDVEKKRLLDAEDMLTDQESLIYALQILLWELCQAEFPLGSDLNKLRSGLIAIGNAMEGLVLTYNAKQGTK